MKSTGKDLITFAISTKNRWNCVDEVLENLIRMGLNELRIIIIDDGSDTKFASEHLRYFPSATLIRHEQSAGYIKRRNELVDRCATKYLFSLDDDSYPIKGDIDELAGFAENSSDLFAISMPVANISGGMQVASSYDRPYACRTYIGCAHLLNVQIFKDMGGYREQFMHQGEEIDICYRAFLRKLNVVHFPDYVVKHLYTPSARSHHRMDFYGARNKVLWNRLYLPSPDAAAANSRALAERILVCLKGGSFSHLRGVYDGLTMRINDWPHRSKDKTVFNKWSSLPIY